MGWGAWVSLKHPQWKICTQYECGLPSSCIILPHPYTITLSIAPEASAISSELHAAGCVCVCWGGALHTDYRSHVSPWPLLVPESISCQQAQLVLSLASGPTITPEDGGSQP